MKAEEQRALIATLFEELVIANGLIKEICSVREITPPAASLSRIEKALHDARDKMSQGFTSDWISVDEKLPESKPGMWSESVIALSDSGDVFRLSCMGSYWQRSKAFIESGSTKITHWTPLIYPE
ncbi:MULTISPECIES: DUF551 domain-containing protein [Klebsiella]|uniref:DUF551 domain-containing protein n=1 Tax=Klebsiella TaxID=570 RepID=UPI001D0D282E|nr:MULTISPECIES: DUF551 domain-containing protein [Klebsiella]MCW9448599.1 DUF551 domain-containing protein [Klebsiella michiganensis]UTJ40056.1 DUF551 domain-containing protein [Klebsiella grimontii]